VPPGEKFSLGRERGARTNGKRDGEIPPPPPLAKVGIRAESKRSLNERLAFPSASWERVNPI
jgi:hypothetical protein